MSNLSILKQYVQFNKQKNLSLKIGTPTLFINQL